MVAISWVTHMQFSLTQAKTYKRSMRGPCAEEERTRKTQQEIWQTSWPHDSNHSTSFRCFSTFLSHWNTHRQTRAFSALWERRERTFPLCMRNMLGSFRLNANKKKEKRKKNNVTSCPLPWTFSCFHHISAQLLLLYSVILGIKKQPFEPQFKKRRSK